jgi:hypothetical protein
VAVQVQVTSIILKARNIKLSCNNRRILPIFSTNTPIENRTQEHNAYCLHTATFFRVWERKSTLLTLRTTLTVLLRISDEACNFILCGNCASWVCSSSQHKQR